MFVGSAGWCIVFTAVLLPDSLCKIRPSGRNTRTRHVKWKWNLKKLGHWNCSFSIKEKDKKLYFLSLYCRYDYKICCESIVILSESFGVQLLHFELFMSLQHSVLPHENKETADIWGQDPIKRPCVIKKSPLTWNLHQNSKVFYCVTIVVLKVISEVHTSSKAINLKASGPLKLQCLLSN